MLNPWWRLQVIGLLALSGLFFWAPTSGSAPLSAPVEHQTSNTIVIKPGQARIESPGRHAAPLDDPTGLQTSAGTEADGRLIRDSAVAQLAQVQAPLELTARPKEPELPAPSAEPSAQPGSEDRRVSALETRVKGFDQRLKNASDEIEITSQALDNLGSRLETELEKLDDVALRLDSLDTQAKRNNAALKKQQSWLEDNSTKLFDALVGIESAQEDLTLLRRAHEQLQSAQAEPNSRGDAEDDRFGLLLPLALCFLVPVAVVIIQGGSHSTSAGATNEARPVAWVVVTWFAGGAAFFLIGIGIMYGPSLGGIIGNPGHFLKSLMLSAPADVPPEWLAQLIPGLVLASIVAVVACSSTPGLLSNRGHFLVAVVTSGLVYPVFGHWIATPSGIAEQTGWLSASAPACPAAATDVAVLGGILALALAYGLGQIRSRSTASTPGFVPASTATTGAMLLWIAWPGVILIANADCLPLTALSPSLAGVIGGAALGALLVDATTSRTQHWQNRLPFAVLAGVVAAPVDGQGATLLELAVLGALAGVSASLLIRFFDSRSTADTRLASSLLVGGIFGGLGPVIFGPAGFLFVHSIDVLAPQLKGMGVVLLLGLAAGLALAWPIGSARFLRKPT